ncbi:MAG TPA: exosortase/archaeosortase family protein, partial [bacterium]|nr:exosortase/archaeosortase family protein [bacterium]
WAGAARARIALPPLLLLLGMIPLPGVWLLALTAHLKSLAAAGGVVVAGLLGVQAVLDGSTVIVAGAPPGPSLVIGDPCSGLRSLLVFASLGLFFALQEESGPLRKVLLAGLALSIAPLSNLLRVVFLIVVRRVIGPVALEGPIHLLAGAGAFGFCFFLYLLAVGRWFRR